MIILRLDKNGGINKGDIKAFEHDNKSETYIIQLYKNNKVYDLTNKTVELTIVEKKRKYGDVVTLPVEAAAEGKVKLEIVAALTKQDGTYDFKLTVKDTAGLIETFPNFQVKIDTDITKNIAGEIAEDKNFTIITEGLKALGEYEVYKTNAKKVPDIEKNVANLGSQLDTIATLKPNGVDDTSNIKKLLSTQKRVKLLDGLFHIRNIELESDVEIIGSSNTKIKLVGLEGQPALYSINAENIQIKGLTFECESKNLYGLGVISLFNSTNCNIEGNKFNNIYRITGGGSSAIDIEGCNNCTILNNRITNSGYGITLGSRVDGDTKLINQTEISIAKYCDNNLIEGNYINTTTMDGIFLSASLNTNVQDCEINNNIVRKNHVENIGDLGIESSRSSNNCIIEDNIVINSAGANIFIRGGDKNIVNNNKCSKAKGKSNSYYSGGIAVSQDFGVITSCIIKNNECFDNSGEGIALGIISDKAIKLSNNKCYNNDIGILLGVNSKGTRVMYNELYDNRIGIDVKYGTSNIAHNRIKYNSIYDNTECGIIVNGERNNIQFNDITANGVGIKSNTGTTCNFNTIKNNDLTSNTQSLLLGNSGTSNIYVNNDGVTDEPKLLISNNGKGYINEIYIDSSNRLCWNKDGSVKKVQLT